MVERRAFQLRWRTLAITVGITAISLLFFVLFNQASPDQAIQNSPSSPTIAPSQGSLAPDFRLASLSGEPFQLNALRGHPTVINFWATWCAPCRIEMPTLQSRFEQYQGEGLRVLAVNFDEPQADVEAFRKEFSLTFDILLDPGGRVQDLFQIRGYPTTFFVDAQGIIQVLHIGVMTEGQLDENLAKIGIVPAN